MQRAYQDLARVASPIASPNQPGDGLGFGAGGGTGLNDQSTIDPEP